MQNTLTVRTLEQAAAWLELDGQISDGMWENARPHSHWQVWCDAEVRVAEPGQPTGRNFYTSKTNYNFTSRELLDVVGTRMLGIVRIARGCGLEAARILEHAVDCETGRVDWHAPWNADRLAQLRVLDVKASDVDAALLDDAYTMRDLRRDLVELKQIVKQVVR